MPFVNENQRFPDNPVTFEPYGEKATNTEDKLIIEELEKIANAVGGGTAKTLANAEQITLGTGVAETPTFAPSFFSVINPSTNDDDVEVTITTTAGDVSFAVGPGENLSPPQIEGLNYTVSGITNGGSTEAEYFAFLIG